VRERERKRERGREREEERERERGRERREREEEREREKERERERERMVAFLRRKVRSASDRKEHSWSFLTGHRITGFVFVFCFLFFVFWWGRGCLFEGEKIGRSYG
jgi:Fe2+ transport system protein B